MPPSYTYTPNCAKLNDFFRSKMTIRPSKRLAPCSQPRIPCPAGHHPASPRENLGVRCGRGKSAKPGSGLDAGRSTSPTNWRRAGASRVPAVSDLLCAWPMLVFCAAPKLMYLLRTVPPDATDTNLAGMEYGMHARPCWQNHPFNRPKAVRNGLCMFIPEARCRHFCAYRADEHGRQIPVARLKHAGYGRLSGG